MTIELPPLPATTILLVEVGSTAHGTGIPGGEDYDQLGVVVETPNQVLGLDEHGFRTVMQRTQPEGARSGPGDVDRTLYPLRRFVRLAASGNPSILMALWAPIDHATEEGRSLQAFGDAFIGRHVVPRYRGYMQSQAERLLGTRGGGHGRRGGAGREELISEHGFDTKYAMHCARLGFQCVELLTTGRLDLPIQGEPADWLRAVRHGAVGFHDWWSRVLDLDQQLGALGNDERFPAGPDRARIEQWSVETHQRVWAQTDDLPITSDNSDRPVLVATPSTTAAMLATDHVHGATAADIPMWAAWWLVDGFDTPAVRRLAGLPGDDGDDVREFLAEALEDLDVPLPPGDLAMAVLLDWYAQRCLAGQLSLLDVARSVYRTYRESGYDNRIADQPLGDVLLVDDEWEGGWGRTHAELREVVAQACTEQVNVARRAGRL